MTLGLKTVMSLNMARYRFHVRVTTPISLPDYAGSTLRGAFGHALLQVCGLSPADRDNNTPLFLQSAYVAVFAPQQSVQRVSLNNLAQWPVPYVIEAPLVKAQTYQTNEQLNFDMVLCGPALNHLSTIILAWRRAFLRGVGAGDGTGELTSVECFGSDGIATTIYTQQQPRVIAHDSSITLPDFNRLYPQGCDVHLLLRTPLRLQQRSKILTPGDMTAPILLRNLIRRVTLQMQIQHVDAWPLERIRQLNDLADKVTDERRLFWQSWGRYSSRQKQAMNLSGVTGDWLLRKVPAELLPFIYLGQWLHLGKETAFGLGKYDWVFTPWQPATKTQNNSTQGQKYV